MLSFECIKNEKSVYFLLTSARGKFFAPTLGSIRGEPNVTTNSYIFKKMPLPILIESGVFCKSTKYLFIIFCFNITDLLHTFCMSAALEGCSEKRIQNLLCQLISDNTCTKCDDLCIVVSDCHLS